MRKIKNNCIKIIKWQDKMVRYHKKQYKIRDIVSKTNIIRKNMKV